jgi:hypothetical protein
MKCGQFLLLSIILLLPRNSHADDIKDALDRFCNKIKVCFEKEIKKHEREHPEVKIGDRSGIDYLAASTCEANRMEFSRVGSNFEKRKLATECLDSVTKMLCKDKNINDIDGLFQTTECDNLKKLNKIKK